jgi:hypothetical protein
MNESQRRNQAALEVTNRAIKTAREQHQRHVDNHLKAKKRTDETVPDNRSELRSASKAFLESVKRMTSKR